MKILYRFGDNDFCTTFTEVFRIILRGVEMSYIKQESLQDKEYVCALINELAYPTYFAMQCHEYQSPKDRDFYVKYFRAAPNKIYIDKEIDDLLAVYGDGNNAWFVLDLNQHDPKWKVYAI
jgi:hypothetical protein